MLARLQARWIPFRNSRDPASLAVLGALALAATLLGLFLVLGPNPWEPSLLKRLAAGKPLKLDHFIQIGLWWGALASFGASLLALATAPWWSPPLAPVFPDPAPPSPRAARWTLLFAFAAMLLAAWPRLARLDHSLWNDEEYHVRTYAWGSYSPAPDGSLAFQPISWKEAIFENEKGNHHLWASVESRLGHALSGHDWSSQSTFSETGFRLFPCASGILTVGLLVLLGAALGSARAGLAAGLILALHPWHVRWSVETRGYSTMLLAITASLFCLVRAFQTNRWRWWLGYAAAQSLFLLSFAGSVYLAAAQNLVALALIFTSPAPFALRRASAARLIAAGILSFIPTALLLGPHLPQIAAYLHSAHDYAPIDASWFADLWAHLVTGLRPTADPPHSSQGIALADLLAAAPWKRAFVFGLIPLLAALGFFALLRQDWRTRLVAASLVLAALLALAHNALSGTAFLTWYLLYLLPIFALSLVWGALALAKALPRSPSSLPLLAALLYSLLTAPALARIINVPRQPIREAVAAMRGRAPALQTADDPILTASFGGGARQMLSYDPRLRILKTTADLENLTQLALTSHRPLFLCLRGLDSLPAECPELCAALASDPRWQPLPPVLGMEAMLSYHLYRFAPDAIPKISLQP